MCLEVGEDYEDTPMVVLVGLGELQLGHDAADVRLHGPLGQPESAGDPPVGASLGHQREDLVLAWREPVQPEQALPRRQQPDDDLVVERGPSGCDPVEGLEEVVDVKHPVLEQVADVARRHKPDGVPGLHVLGEQHDPQVGELVPDLGGGAGSVVGVVRRHPDVQDHEVGCGTPYRGDRLDRIGGRRHHLVARVDQQPGQPDPEERGVLADHDSHGSTASTTVPAPARRA
jgi:hypothetical protein